MGRKSSGVYVAHQVWPDKARNSGLALVQAVVNIVGQRLNNNSSIHCWCLNCVLKANWTDSCGVETAWAGSLCAAVPLQARWKDCIHLFYCIKTLCKYVHCWLLREQLLCRQCIHRGQFMSSQWMLTNICQFVTHIHTQMDIIMQEEGSGPSAPGGRPGIPLFHPSRLGAEYQRKVVWIVC